MASKWLADRLAGFGVPKAHCLVSRCSDDALTVRAKRRTTHKIVMASERFADLLAGRRVAQSGSPVGRRSDDPLAVGAECHTLHRAVMSFKWLADRLPLTALRNGRDILRKTKADARLRRIFAEPLSLDFWVRVQLTPKQLPL